MRAVLVALVVALVSVLRSRASLQLELLALRHQLVVLQRAGRRPRLKPADRVLWGWLSRTWSGWDTRELRSLPLVLVKPSTVISWQRKRFRDHWTQLSRAGRRGRPAIAKEIRDLIRKMSESDPAWGSPRIRSELRKLGINVAKSTVEKYRVRPRKPPSPTWRAFLANHVGELVSLDFFTVATVHLRRILEEYFTHYHRWRCHQSLEMDCPEPRAVQPSEVGQVVEIREAGGLYRHYERAAA